MSRWIRYTIFALIFSLHCSEGKHKMHLVLGGKRMWQFCEGRIKYICHPQGKFVTKMKCNILWMFCLKKKLLVGNIMNLISAHWQYPYAVYLSFFCSKLGKIKWLGNFVKRSPHKRVAASGVVSFGQSFGILRESRDTSDLLHTSFSRVSGLFHW